MNRSDRLGLTLRGIGWRLMLSVYSNQSSKWPEDMKRNIDDFETWRSELFKDLQNMRKIYREHKHHTDLNAADLEQIYNHDYQIALKYHKHMRLVFIRSQRK